ncbi:MAG: hypothetical protein PHR35_09615, partial [Kiritimatiellae bacterium]|nr:hypothetical protein [Kiritimatiellia bacterium]
MKKINRSLVALLLAGVSIGLAAVCCAQTAATKAGETNAAPAAVRCDLKPAFPALIEEGKRSNDVYLANAIFAEESDCFAGKPALRLDCKNAKAGAVIANVWFPDDRLPDFRGKRVVFRWQVKWLKGGGALDTVLRCSGRKADGGGELVATAFAAFQGEKGEKGKWTPFELKCMLPDRADLHGVNFQTRLFTTDVTNPPVILLGECVLELAAATNTPTIEP